MFHQTLWACIDIQCNYHCYSGILLAFDVSHALPASSTTFASNHWDSPGLISHHWFMHRKIFWFHTSFSVNFSRYNIGFYYIQYIQFSMCSPECVVPPLPSSWISVCIGEYRYLHMQLTLKINMHFWVHLKMWAWHILDSCKSYYGPEPYLRIIIINNSCMMHCWDHNGFTRTP